MDGPQAITTLPGATFALVTALVALRSDVSPRRVRPTTGDGEPCAQLRRVSYRLAPDFNLVAYVMPTIFPPYELPWIGCGPQLKISTSTPTRLDHDVAIRVGRVGLGRAPLEVVLDDLVDSFSLGRRHAVVAGQQRDFLAAVLRDEREGDTAG